MPNAAWRNEDWTRCVAFHGHECPGLAIGFMAAKAGLAWIESTRAEDEEVVTIVENDACGVDAVQVLTGCTFGKGNLIHKDYGKQVFTFFNRDTGRAARFSLKSGATPLDPRYRELMMKSREGAVSAEERDELAQRRENAMRTILETPTEALFTKTDPRVELPDMARVQRSEPCAVCGEPTMPLKMIERDGKRLCRGCEESGR